MLVCFPSGVISPPVADTTARCWSQGEEDSAGPKTYAKRRRHHLTAGSPSLKQQQHLQSQQEQEHGAAHSLMELSSAHSSPAKNTRATQQQQHGQQWQGKTPVKITRSYGKVV